MSDTTWVRVYGSKAFFAQGEIRSNGVIRGYGGVYYSGYLCTYTTDGQVHSFCVGGNWEYLHVSTYWNQNGQGYAYGVNWWLSDSRLKTDIADTDIGGIDFVKQLHHVKFKWKRPTANGDSVKIGYLAHELQQQDENIVHKVPQPEGSEYQDLLQINETKLIPYLSKALQELIVIVEAQEKEIKQLKASHGLA